MSYLVHILSNINFQELKRYVFIVFLKQFVVIAHLSSFGKLFHRIAAPVSIRRLPYRTHLYNQKVTYVAPNQNELLN